VRPGLAQLVGSDDRAATALAAALARRETRLGALADQIALELREEPKMLNTSMPPGVVVSMFSVSERNPMPRDANSPIFSIRWLIERPSRSSFHTTSVSPRADRPALQQDRACRPGARRMIVENTVASCPLQCVVLKRELLVGVDTRA
jgi:hypothetical protein